MTLTIHMRRRERFTAFHACKCRGVISLGTNPRHPTSTGNPNDPTYETYEHTKHTKHTKYTKYTKHTNNPYRPKEAR